MEILELLRNIQKRPTLYLSRRSIFDLQTFCNAYQLSRHDLGLPESEQQQQFAKFIIWLRQRLNSHTSHSWASLILFHSSLEGDEGKALDKFFQLLDEFLEIKGDLSEKSYRENVTHFPSTLTTLPEASSVSTLAESGG